MKTNSTNIFEAVSIEGHLDPYLKLSGWQLSEETNTNWLVYKGVEDSNGEPLEIVLPRYSKVANFRSYVENAINLLAGLKDEDIQLTIQKIILYDCDVLYTRNLETGEFNSISLRLATKQVNQLRNIIAYSACSEHEPKPHFLGYQLSTAQKMINHYRFGHTFAGSFGFTIESQIISSPKLIEYQQLPLFDPLFDEEPPTEIMPVERRIMERIARGLNATEQATKKHDLQFLIGEYASGFNANMCKAFVDFSVEKKLPIEYSIMWSPKLKPANEIFEFKPVRLYERSYEYLENAAESLRELKPEFVTVKGHIIGLSSRENPLGTSEANRSIVISGRFLEKTKPVKILVDLEKDDYINATNAHLQWKTIEVNGVISRTGNYWRLSSPQNFIILD